ncbi:para-nitrobenzyl esterase [Halopseudomonas xinjiangensis]|uniref:Carboxylic ester hydrolase n=1 Tax=Halopseudomonas xinjiangensis TaxID=487184 RepID=A0A1H1NLX1_9GAMM|nr:carboxylesterase family protein [Halopseudomonas xinjiangensis]SDR99863.1 para-nitrobenzyl esterase [Halopseudomonas xinjiangensis]
MRSSQRFSTARRPLAFACLAAAMALQAGCLDGSDNDDDHDSATQTGIFIDSPVSGLGYKTPTQEGVTDAEGRFEYRADETVTFSIGELELGSAAGADRVSPINLMPGAQDASDPAVTNLSILLQSLDQDGDLNNGIQITDAIATTVSEHANALDPDSDAFTQAMNDLLVELNAAQPPVFTDTDPRPRTARPAAQAQAHLARSLAPQKVVTIEQGDIAGFEADDGAWSWYGIPYAKAPLGDLRWKPPVAPEPWEGVRLATSWANQSAQNPGYEAFGEGGMSEDSLYLNVTVPEGYEGQQLPVMVWFHGGGFSILTGNTKAFNNTSLPKEGVIVVTVNHRLGPLGYLSHPALTAESERNASGNYGQLDLVAALQWVQRNIEAFGGDPDNVTIFGESGGGGKSLSLLHSPLATGLFHKAIIQSGMGTPEHGGRYPVRWTLEQNEAEGQRLIEALGLANEPDIAAALRQVPWTELVTTADAIGFEAYPTIDGYYSTMGIQEAYLAGEHNDVPIIAGANSGDYPDLREGLVWYMPWMADANEADMFAYVFDHVPENWAANGTEAYHGIELVYVFDYYGSFLSHYLLGLSGHESPTPQKYAANLPGVTAVDDKISDDMRSLWAEFARTGNPSTDAINWPAYTPQSDAYLRTQQNPTVETGLESAFPPAAP